MYRVTKQLWKASRTPLPASGVILQRRCACGSLVVAGGCEELRDKHLLPLQRTALGELPLREAPPVVHDVLCSPGKPLEPSTRAFMEPRFGHDFSQVRVHTGPQVAESATSVRARAFTFGNHVVFAPGEYQPLTRVGKSLLAHELTHFVQQSNGIQAKLAVSQPGDPYELEADRVARAIDQDALFSPSKAAGVGLMRQVDVPPGVETVPPVAEPVKSATEEDENVKELKDKVSKLVNKKFGGDYKKAFDYYDANKDAGVDAAELKKLLEDAGVGNSLTRGAWVKGIMNRLDTNKDGKIQWSEFESVTK